MMVKDSYLKSSNNIVIFIELPFAGTFLVGPQGFLKGDK